MTGERITRGKAIRLKCLGCCCGSAMEVRLCAAQGCPLWRYRLGKEICEDAGDFSENHPGDVSAQPKEVTP